MTKRILIILLLLNLVLSLFAVGGTIPDEGEIAPIAEGGSSDNVDIKSSFTLFFEKPAKNVFYFSDPDAPTKEFQPTNGVGLQFPLAETGATAKTNGYPSRTHIGIYFNLESRSVLKVYFNSSSTHDDKAFRMRPKDKNQDGLNYAIGFAATKAEADNRLDEILELKKFYGTIPLKNADAPVLTLYAHKEGTVTEGVEYLGEMTVGSRVFAMELRGGKADSGKDYVGYTEGQYTGYVTLELEMI